MDPKTDDGSKIIPIAMSLNQAKAAFTAVSVIFEASAYVPNKSPEEQGALKNLAGAMLQLAKYIDKAEESNAL